MTSILATNWDSLTLLGVNPTGKEIGRGAYGRVFEIDYEGTLCAAKEVHAILLKYAQGNDLQKIKDDFLSECQIWSTLRHPCVVQFLGVYYPAMDQYRLPVMVMEKMQHSLRDLAEKFNDIPLNVKLSILDEVCLGLRYLHSRNPPIVHRDLTPNNILLSRFLEAKITDLGVAKIMQTTDTKTMTKAPGTTDFMPPECLADRPVYGLPLDVFSYGGVILYTITQLWPQPSSWIQFDPKTGRKLFLSEVQRRQRYLDEMAGNTAKLKTLVISCLDDNPKSRPPVAQVSSVIKMVKDKCSQESGRDGMSPIVWWAGVSNEQSQEVSSSLTNALEESTKNNEQLQREIHTLKTDNMELKATNNTMKDKVKQLTAKFDKTVEQLKSQSSKIETVKDENKQLKTKLQQLKQQVVKKEATLPSDLFSRPVNIKWKEGASAPVGGYGHTAVWLNGLVYVGGGYPETLSMGSYIINCYNPVTNAWTSPIDVPCCFFAMTALNNNLLIAGGQDKSYKRTNEILIMDAGQLKHYTKMITAMSSATAAGHQGILIITGGWDDEGKILSSTELFDSSNGQWYTCSELPQPYHSLRSVIVDNILYLLGGNDDTHKPSLAVFTAPLNTLSKHKLKWHTHQDTPWYRSTPVSVYGTHLLIVGGSKKIGGNDYARNSDVYKLNKANHSWKRIECIPSERSSPAAISIADKLIVIGGRNNNKEATNTVWIGSCEPQ